MVLAESQHKSESAFPLHTVSRSNVSKGLSLLVSGSSLQLWHPSHDPYRAVSSTLSCRHESVQEISFQCHRRLCFCNVFCHIGICAPQCFSNGAIGNNDDRRPQHLQSIRCKSIQDFENEIVRVVYDCDTTGARHCMVSTAVVCSTENHTAIYRRYR